MNLYEQKMPAYLAMSRADLIAEILEQGDRVSEWLTDNPEHTGVASALAVALGSDDGESGTEMPKDIQRCRDTVGIANDCLRQRFGITIEFTYGLPGTAAYDDDLSF